MNDDPFAPSRGAGAPRTADTKQKWISVAPVPADAPPPMATHRTLGAPSATWTYTDAAGAVLGYVRRFNAAEEKEFRPLTLWRPDAGGKLEWRWESWPPKRPLYGLQRLAERPSAPVVICEGEKAADAATRLLPGFVTVTSPNGSKSAGKADWSALRGREVTVWPDADAAGLEYARQVAKLATAAGAVSVAIVAPPPDCKIGWDAADALAEGWDEARATSLINAAKPAAPKMSSSGKSGAGRNDIPEHDASGGRRRTPQRDTLIGLTECCEFWHDADRTGYATYTVNGHDEHWPVRSRDFRMFVSKRFYEETGLVPSGQALEDGIRILEARAVNDGPEYEPFIRVGRHGDKLFLDLCDARWRAVEITADDWRVVEKPPVKFWRSAGMHALPEPEKGGMIEELRGFLSVRGDDDFIMVVAWLVAALWGRRPYPVLVLNGEQGTGKSVFSRMIRSLVDPNAAPIRALSKHEHDLAVSAGNSWVLAFDNISSVPSLLSDALAGLATGRGFATRKHYTGREEEIFQASRPILLNGIPLLTERADLADRTLRIHLAVIPDDARQPEDELFAAFDARQPAILGALLDGMSAALRYFPTVKIEVSPRMADLVKVVTAAEPGFGWEPGAFLRAYGANRRDVIESSIEAEPLAMAIIDYVPVEHPEGWSATPTEWSSALNSRVSEAVRRSRRWPDTPQRLGGKIDRIAPLLRSKGFAVDHRHSGKNIITIVPPRTS